MSLEQNWERQWRLELLWQMGFFYLKYNFKLWSHGNFCFFFVQKITRKKNKLWPFRIKRAFQVIAISICMDCPKMILFLFWFMFTFYLTFCRQARQSNGQNACKKKTKHWCVCVRKNWSFGEWTERPSHSFHHKSIHTILHTNTTI